MKTIFKLLFISPVFAVGFFISGYLAINTYLTKGISLNFFLSLGGFSCFVVLLIIGAVFVKFKEKFKEK